MDKDTFEALIMYPDEVLADEGWKPEWISDKEFKIGESKYAEAES